MSRVAVQKLAHRMYQALVKVKGRLPAAKEIRDIERKALRAAERAENRKGKR